MPDDDDFAQGWSEGIIKAVGVQKAAIPEAFLESIAQRCRAMGEPSRLRLLQELMLGERSVKLLVEATGLTQSNASRHLQALYDASLALSRVTVPVVYFLIQKRLRRVS